MTDKVQKIREEVERLKLCTMDEHMKFYSEAAEAEYNALCNIEHFIDSLQEEPVSEQNLSNVQRTVKNWKEEPVSEGLGEYIFELSKQFPEVSFAKLSRIAVRVAQWQKEQMMSKAIDALVHTFDNGYIRVGTQLLENNKYGLKVGDKVKVIIIKDE